MLDIELNINRDKIYRSQRFDATLRHEVQYHSLLRVEYQHFSFSQSSLSLQLSRLYIVFAFLSIESLTILRYSMQYSLRIVCMQMQS